MEKSSFSEEQIKDIQEREAKGLQALKELELTPAAVLQKLNVGNDVFADKVIPYLQDTKYATKPEPVLSPIQDVKSDESSTPSA